MFYKRTGGGYTEILDGIRIKTMVYGKNTLFTKFRLTKGCILPRHDHPYEQTGYFVEGRLRLYIGEDTFEVAPGDSWCIFSNVEHGAEILEDAIAVEVFSPVREDYLPENLK